MVQADADLGIFCLKMAGKTLRNAISWMDERKGTDNEALQTDKH